MFSQAMILPLPMLVWRIHQENRKGCPELVLVTRSRAVMSACVRVQTNAVANDPLAAIGFHNHEKAPTTAFTFKTLLP